MKIDVITTRPLRPPQDDLLMAITEALPSVAERSVVILASKVVSIWQGQCLLKVEVPSKDLLIQQEADWYLPRRSVLGVPCLHTLKNNLLVPSAGIDESNADGYYILWPKDLRQTTKKLWQWLRNHYKVKELGVLVTDSHTISLRRGVMGISLSHYGFAPLKDYRGETDLFGRVLKMTQTNVADALAAAAVLLMGEGSDARHSPLQLRFHRSVLLPSRYGQLDHTHRSRLLPTRTGTTHSWPHCHGNGAVAERKLLAKLCLDTNIEKDTNFYRRVGAD